jgi:hypothetical protein
MCVPWCRYSCMCVLQAIAVMHATLKETTGGSAKLKFGVAISKPPTFVATAATDNVFCLTNGVSPCSRGIVMETPTVRGTNATHIEMPNAMDSAAQEAPSNAVCYVISKAVTVFGSTYSHGQLHNTITPGHHCTPLSTQDGNVKPLPRRDDGQSTTVVVQAHVQPTFSIVASLGSAGLTCRRKANSSLLRTLHRPSCFIQDKLEVQGPAIDRHKWHSQFAY